MKIVHVALMFEEGWGYQENLLPLYQSDNGDDVVIVTDYNHVNDYRRPKIQTPEREYVYNNVKICRIDTYLNTHSFSFLCRGLYRLLEKEKPDVIFHHDLLSFSTLFIVLQFKKKHKDVKLYVDNHVDWLNENKNLIWHFTFYDFIIPLQVRLYQHLINYYLGVTPLRCQYLHDVFKVKEDKIKYLPIGCDTKSVDMQVPSKIELRAHFTIEDDCLVVASGGKMEKRKGTISLIKACDFLFKSGTNLKLILFGKMDDEVASIINNKPWINVMGWCDRKLTLSLLKMSDIACWPLLHTTLIEDAVAAGTPIIVKKSDNVRHFEKTNAGVFLEEGNVEELIESILKILNNYPSYKENVEKARDLFSYSTIVKRLNDESFYTI